MGNDAAKQQKREGMKRHPTRRVSGTSSSTFKNGTKTLKSIEGVQAVSSESMGAEYEKLVEEYEAEEQGRWPLGVRYEVCD